MRIRILMSVTLFLIAVNVSAVRFVSARNGVNVRKGPGTGSPVLFSLPHGEMVRPTGCSVPDRVGGKEGAWVEIRWKWYKGYIFSTFLRSSGLSLSRPGMERLYRSLYACNRNSEAAIVESINGRLLGRIPITKSILNSRNIHLWQSGSTRPIHFIIQGGELNTAGMYLREKKHHVRLKLKLIRYRFPSSGDKTGEIRAYFRLVQVMNITEQGIVNDSYTRIAPYFITARRGLNLRKGPGTEYPVLTAVPSGEMVEYRARWKEGFLRAKPVRWAEISWKGRTGFVLWKFLKKITWEKDTTAPDLALLHLFERYNRINKRGTFLIKKNGVGGELSDCTMNGNNLIITGMLPPAYHHRFVCTGRSVRRIFERVRSGKPTRVYFHMRRYRSSTLPAGEKIVIWLHLLRMENIRNQSNQ